MLPSLPAMAIARQRDPEAVRVGLEDWLREPVGAISRPSSTGLPSEIYFFDTANGPLVARLAPDGEGLFPAYDLAMQAQVMQALRAHDVVPVPRIIAYVDDARWLGAPFLVMQRAEGRLPANDPPFTLVGWVHDASPDRQRALQDQFLDVCARIHRADWRALGLGEVAARPGGTSLRSEVAWWSDYLEFAAEGSPSGLLSEARSWCTEHIPAHEPEPSLCWGNVRIPNVVFDVDDHPSAVLDWEMASIGPAELDIGWYLVTHAMTAGTSGDLPGFRPRAELLRRYEAQLGRELHDLAWYEAWAAFRSAAITVRLTVLLHDHGLVPDLSMQEHNPPSDLLRALLA
jgi:aminoglycoside phosphotransferase (APT) family kinase protein